MSDMSLAGPYRAAGSYIYADSHRGAVSTPIARVDAPWQVYGESSEIAQLLAAAPTLLAAAQQAYKALRHAYILKPSPEVLAAYDALEHAILAADGDLP